MDQDVALGVTLTVTQADLAFLRNALRLGEYPVVYRVHRLQKGGGFGDQNRHPFAWGILVYVDEQLARINSARGAGREWNDLDKAEIWLRGQGFSYWWTRNDLEPAGNLPIGDDESTDKARAQPNEAGLPAAKFSLK